MSRIATLGMAQAAAHLGVSRWTIYRLVTTGALPVVTTPPWSGTRPHRRIAIAELDRIAAIRNHPAPDLTEETS